MLKFAPAWLLNTAPTPTSSPLAPVHVAAPALLKVPLASCFSALPLIVSVPVAVTVVTCVAAPLIVPPVQANAPDTVNEPVPDRKPPLIAALGLVVGPLKSVVPPEIARDVVMAVLPEKVMVPPVTDRLLRVATEVTVSGPTLTASVEEPWTLSELMVRLGATSEPTVTVNPVGMQTSSVETGMPVVQLPAVPHKPLPAVPVQVFEPQVPSAVPMPARETVCGLPAALSVIESEAERVLVAEGVKVTSMTQVPFVKATVEPFVQVVVAGTMVKSAAFVPPSDTVLMFSVALPVLVSVTRSAALVVSLVCDGKVRLGGDKLTAGAAVGPKTVKTYAAILPTTGLQPPKTVVMMEAASCPSVA